MSHINARLNVRGRALLVERVLGGRPAAHVAKELGISRQCAYRWVRRYQTRQPTARDWLHPPCTRHSRNVKGECLTERY